MRSHIGLMVALLEKSQYYFETVAICTIIDTSETMSFQIVIFHGAEMFASQSSPMELVGIASDVAFVRCI